MKFKNLLLGAASVAVIGGASQAQAGPFYVSVFGGLNFAQDKSAATTYTHVTGTRLLTHTGAISENTKTGFVLGGAVGVHLTNWVQGLRAELEASYRRNHVHGNWNTHITTHFRTGGEGVRTAQETAAGTINGHVSTFAVMANVWYDVDLGSKFRPYVGGGAGWARSRLSFVAVTSLNNSSSAFAQENNGFAYQLGAGVNYEVMHGTSVGVGYRFFRGPDLNVFFQGKFGTNIPIKYRNENQSVELSLSIDID